MQPFGCMSSVELNGNRFEFSLPIERRDREGNEEDSGVNADTVTERSLPNLCREAQPQFLGGSRGASAFRATGPVAQKRNDAHGQFVSLQHLGVSGDGHLAAAAHGFEKGAFGANGLHGWPVV